MSISVRDLADVPSVRDAAHERGVDYEPFSVRELVTPQVGGPVDSETRTWANWIDDFEEERKRIAPESRMGLLAAVVEMIQSDTELRAVGSGHSHSKAPEPPEHYVDFENLRGTLSHRGWLKPTSQLGVSDEKYLQRLKAGTILRDLNRDVLAPKGLALYNMGSFDGQTIAGAINTSTHGTGIGLATLADTVKSVEIVTVPESVSGQPLARMFRIEPSDGITDREAFEADTGEHGMELIQDDDVFHSVVVGYGCMGIVYACTLEVRDAFWLKETSKLRKWSDLRSEFQRRGVRNVVDDDRHFMFLLNLPAVQGRDTNETDPDDPVCLVRSHAVTAPDDKPNHWGRRWPPERRKTEARDVGTFFAGENMHPLKPHPVFGKRLHNNFFEPEANKDPFVKGRTRTASYIALRRLRDRNNDPPKPPTEAISTEIAVPLEHLVDAIDAAIEEVQRIKQTHTYNPPFSRPKEKEYDIFFGSPMGVRFTAASEHYLAPEFERPTAMIEVPMPVLGANATLRSQVPDLAKWQIRDEVAKPALEVIEQRLIREFEGRPHMGKHNSLTESDLRGMYDHFEEDGGWMDTYRRFNAFGTFNNDFTSALGIDQ